MRLKLLSMPNLILFSSDAAMKCIENVFGVISFEKSHLNVTTHSETIYVPLMHSCEDSKINFDRVVRFLDRYSFSSKRYSDPPIKLGQIQCVFSTAIPENTEEVLRVNSELLIKHGNDISPSMVERGGGMQSVSFSRLSETMGVVDFTYNVQCANGANIVNKVAEGLASHIKDLLSCRIVTRILSNEDKQRFSTVELQFSPNELPSTLINSCKRVETLDKSSEDYRLLMEALLDGIQPVIEATGNDWRGTDASILVHALEAELFSIQENESGVCLTCSLPLSVGVVGVVNRFPGSAYEIDKIKPKTAEDIAERAVLSGLLSLLSFMEEHLYSDVSQPHYETRVFEGYSCRTNNKNDRLRVRNLTRIEERVMAIAQHVGKEVDWFSYLRSQPIDPEKYHSLPIGFSPRFVINDVTFDVIPFVVEEPSVVAANSYMAGKIATIDPSMPGITPSVYVTTDQTESHFIIDLSFYIKTALLATTSTEGEEYKQGIMDVYQFSKLNKARACTQNKGFMNGVDPILMALGLKKSILSTSLYQQFFKGKMEPFVTIEASDDSDGLGSGLHVRMKAAVPKALFENMENKAPWAKKNLELMGNPCPSVLSAIVLSSGCFSTLAALKALGVKGINWGHMKLHLHGI